MKTMKKLTLILLLSLFSVSNSFSQVPPHMMNEYLLFYVSEDFYNLLLTQTLLDLGIYSDDDPDESVITLGEAAQIQRIWIQDRGLSGEFIKPGDIDKYYMPMLDAIDINDNNFTALDISLSSCNYLGCRNNQITSLIVNDNLTNLYCDTNNLSVLDLTQCTKLYNLTCTGNPNLTQICLSAFSYQEMLDHPSSFKKDETAEWLNCETTTGVSSSTENNLRLQYNLGDAYVKVLNAEKIDIYNADGQKKASVSADKLNISSLPSGIYIVHAYNAQKEMFSDKFLKIH